MSTTAALAPDDEPVGAAALGVGTLGLWTRAEALGVLSPGRVDAAVRSGRWQTPWPGVHADGGIDLDPEQEAVAAVLASGGGVERRAHGPRDPSTGERPLRAVAVAAGRTAARCWALPLIDDDDPATGARDRLHADVAVLVQQRHLVHGDRVLHRHQPTFGAGDVVRLPSGLWITSVLRTLVDLRLLVEPDALVCALDAALHAGLVTPVALERAVRRTKGWRGAPAFRRAVERSDGRAESPGETLTRLLLAPALPGLVPQVEVVDAVGRLRATFDLADEHLRLAVEFDGRAAHEGGLMVARDRRRDRLTGLEDWHTERVGWYDVRRLPQSTRRDLVRVAERLRGERAGRGGEHAAPSGAPPRSP